MLSRKIPRLNKNSQAVLKTRENSENENTYIHKHREKISYLGYMATLYQIYRLTESEFEHPVTALTQKLINVIIRLV